MSKYGKQSYRQVKEKEWEVHPVWRGIGCIIVILLPIMAWAAAMLVVSENAKSGWVEIPLELRGWVDFSSIYRAVPFLRPVISALPRLYYLDSLVTFAFLLIGFGLLSVMYSFLWRLAGGGRKSPLDAEPIRKSPRKGLNRSR